MYKLRTLISLSLAAVCALGQEPLTNEAVMKMIKAGLSDEIVIGTIARKPGKYATSPDDLIALKTAGVSDKVIAAMVRGGAAPTGVQPSASSVARPLVLPDGTPVRLRLSRTLSSADEKAGATVDFEVLEDVKIDDVLLVARGGTAIGTVTEAEHKKRMARGGKLDVNIDYVRLVNGDKVALRAVKESRGGGHTGAMTGGISGQRNCVFSCRAILPFHARKGHCHSKKGRKSRHT